MKSISYLILLVFAITSFAACSQKSISNQLIANITAVEVKKLMDSENKPVLLDVRTEAEYIGSLGKIDGSILIPLQELNERVEELNPYKDQRIIIYCRSGNRSQVAARILMEHSFDVVNMEGGMKAWNKL